MSLEIVAIIPKNEWLTLNGRLTYWPKAERIRLLRRRGKILAQGKPRFASKATCYVEVQGRTSNRFDAHNTMPTLKALVDGFVDAGILTDDSQDYLRGPWPEAGEPDPSLPLGAHKLIFRFEVG